MQDGSQTQEVPTEVVVVSEAGTDLGRALSVALARRGVVVIGISRVANGGDEVRMVAADIADPEDTARAFAEIREDHGAPTILINTSEVYPHRDILEETPVSFMDTMRINLGGAFNCCHAVLPDMVATGTGRIINVVTFADIVPAPLAAGYSVSKGAVRILTKSLVADLGSRFPGIVINDWVPGTHAPRQGLPDGIDPAVAAEWGASLALLKAPEISGMVFLRDREHRPHRSLQGKLKDYVFGRRREVVRLD